VDASTQCGEDELGYRDKNATNTLITDAQDFLSI
jgi:hypothetical protein